MRRAIGTVVLFVAIVAAVGFYRGWFVAQSTSSPNGASLRININKGAIRSDSAQAEQKAREAAQKLDQQLNATSRLPPTHEFKSRRFAHRARQASKSE